MSDPIFKLKKMEFTYVSWVLDTTCPDQALIRATVTFIIEARDILISVIIAPQNTSGPFVSVNEALNNSPSWIGGDSKLKDAVKRSAKSLKELKGRRAVFITTDKPSHMVAKEIEELKKNDIFVVFLSFGGPRGLRIADEHLHIPSEQYLQQMRRDWEELQVQPRLELQQRLENQVALQLHWAHPEVVSAAYLLIHTQHNWKQVRAAPLLQSNQKKTSVTFLYDGLLEDTEYPFKGELTLYNGQKVSSKLLTVRTRKYTPLGKLFMDLLRVEQECKNAKEFITWFSGRLRHMIRIGLIGKSGSGKSSVFNSLTSIFSGRLQMTNTAGISPALVRKTKLELIDMFGWELQGRLTTHYENDVQSLMDGCASDSLFPRETLQNPTRRKWYGAIFCVSPEEVDNPKELQYIQDLYEMFQSRGLCPVVFLTACDRIDPELKEHPELVYRSDAIEGYINRLSSKVISSQRIFPVLSYFDYRVTSKAPLDPIKNCTLLIAFRALLENMKAALTDVLPDEPKPEPPKDKLPEPFYVLAKRKGDTSFQRCSVPDRNISSLKDALQAKFNLEIAPTMIQERQPDNNNYVNIIEHDSDVRNLKNEPYLEFL